MHGMIWMQDVVAVTLWIKTMKISTTTQVM